MDGDSKGTGSKELSKLRRILHWVKIIVVGAMGLVFVLACAGAAYQWIAHNRDMRQNPRPGKLVDVGGYRMHLYCMGQGSPTVVFDSGLGDTWLAWYKVQAPIGQFTRVCSYDRAGLGWSDPSPHPRTSKVIAWELHSLLHMAGMPGPFVLVGHSFGGMNVRMYARLFPAEVAGVVLADSVHPDQQRRRTPEQSRAIAAFLRVLSLKADTIPFGISRLMGWCGNGPAEIRPMLHTVECRLGPWREHVAEEGSFAESAEQARTAGPLGSIPLVVLSHDPEKLYPIPGSSPRSDKDFNPLWEEFQGELAQLSTNASRVVATGSGHYIQYDRPDLVIEAVRKLVAPGSGH
jgi:pimeloyl-ACP methyl ester carboxylesterase